MFNNMFVYVINRVLIQGRPDEGQANSEIIEGHQSNDDDEVANILSQSQSNDAPIASYGSSSSNNLMNSNLSGSMKRFNRNQRTVNEDDSDDDDDECNDSNRFHECFEPNQSIFAPISTSQPIINPIDQQQVPMQSNYGAGMSDQRIVAALPNLEFDQFSMSRGISASSPSLYSQPESNSRRNSAGSDQRRTDFARNTTASSNNYFV